ncbi:hypothetical protein [Brachyspira alvinipulli]|uniref:hypothetical protein n=1 Tax=Brachyspira alvinipulli TaxID=84379 RepID=UPI000488AB08|nr:hypothetical protein [Brachyspira alvinipulli]
MKYILIIILSAVIVSCQTTKYVTVPLSEPPNIYKPNDNITTQKQLLKEYQRSLIKITEWQKWYNAQIYSN